MSNIFKKFKRRSKRPTAAQAKGRRSEEDVKEEKSSNAPAVRRVRTAVPVAPEEDSTSTPQVTPKKSLTRARTQRATMDSVSPEVDAACQDFISHHINTDRILEEYEQLQKLQPEEAEHRRCCQENDRRRGTVPCLDATRLVLKPEEGETGGNDFIHASRVKLDHVEREYILGQTPLPNTVEDFWRMIFQEQSASIVVTSTHYEDGKESSPCFWPMDAGTYKYYGRMFVNNKRVETNSATTVYTIEVLPNGCSNSLVTTLYHYTAWNRNTYVASHRALINLRTQVRANEGGPLTVVSTEGAGRAAMYAAIDATLTRLFKGVKTRLLDVAIQLRKQRAHSLCYHMTYVFPVQLVFNYIKAKIKKYEGFDDQFIRQINEKLKRKIDPAKEDGGGTKGSKE